MQRAAVDEAINALVTTDAGGAKKDLLSSNGICLGLLYEPHVLAGACVLNCVEKEIDRRAAMEAVKLKEDVMSDLTELLSEGRSERCSVCFLVVFEISFVLFLVLRFCQSK